MVSCDSDEDYKDAAKYAGIIPEDTDDVDGLAAEGRAHYKAGAYKAAKMAFVEAETVDPLLPGRCKHANNLSACMLRLGEYEGALEQTERVLEVDPDNVKAICRQWVALEKLGKSNDGSPSMLCRLAHLSRPAPNDEMNGEPDAHMRAFAADEEARQEKCHELRKMGNEMMREGRQDDAVEMYTAALKENPSDVAASNNRAQAYLNLKRYSDAEKDATVVLQADPANIKARYRRARARLNLPKPDKEGGCVDLARVVSQNPKSHNEAIDCLARAVEGMDLDTDGDDVFPEEDHCSKMPGEERAKSDNETSAGDGAAGFEEMAVQDKEVARQPSTGAHLQAKRRPGSLTIVEEDDLGGCSWCPLTIDEREEDRQVSDDYWETGEQFRKSKDWAEALQVFTKGVVANPSNAKCWIGVSRVHREQGNYKNSSEAATRAQNAAPTSALLCEAVTRLNESKDRTEDERAHYVRSVWQELEGRRIDGTVENEEQESDCAEERAILSAILPLAETEARH